MFFTYIYCNPLKSSALHECGFEPFYVGKGKNNRHLSHLLRSSLIKSSNPHKTNTIKKILAAGLKPIVIKTGVFDNEQSALDEEVRLIALYGRTCKKQGPLTNISPGGQETTANKKYRRCERTTEEKVAISKGLKGQKHSEDRKAAIKAAMVEAKKKQQKKWLVVTPETSYCLVSLDYLRENGLIGVSATVRSGKPISRGKFKGWQVSQIMTS